jgi:hypothetical protein
LQEFKHLTHAINARAAATLEKHKLYIQPIYIITHDISSHQMNAQHQAIPRQDLYRCSKIPHEAKEVMRGGHVLLNLIPSFGIFVSSITLKKKEEKEVQ